MMMGEEMGGMEELGEEFCPECPRETEEELMMEEGMTGGGEEEMMMGEETRMMEELGEEETMMMGEEFEPGVTTPTIPIPPPVIAPPLPFPPCWRYRRIALKYLHAYRSTQNRKYLCYYYLYLARYFCCLHKYTRNVIYLKRCKYYRALYARCI
jgi:hypothetical protein